jgi:hypothetical protein
MPRPVADKTAHSARSAALARFDASPTPSTGRVLEDATKLVARVVEGLKFEAFEGLGFKAENGAADSIVAKLEKMTRSLTALIEADVKYHKAAKDRAKALTKAEYQDVILKFLMTDLHHQERSDFIKKLAKAHVKQLNIEHPSGGDTMEDSKLIKEATKDAEGEDHGVAP